MTIYIVHIHLYSTYALHMYYSASQQLQDGTSHCFFSVKPLCWKSFTRLGDRGGIFGMSDLDTSCPTVPKQPSSCTSACLRLINSQNKQMTADGENLLEDSMYSLRGWESRKTIKDTAYDTYETIWFGEHHILVNCKFDLHWILLTHATK